MKNQTPIVLDLAPLPREQIGPFLLLGLPKDVAGDEIHAFWAQRIIWARRNQIRTPLEDINWAREVINDPDKRVRADAASLNVDTVDGTLRRLAERAAGKQPDGVHCQPLDVEKPLADYAPAVDVPDLNEVRAAVVVPDVPEEYPAVPRLLEQFLQEPLDPWQLDVAKD